MLRIIRLNKSDSFRMLLLLVIASTVACSKGSDEADSSRGRLKATAEEAEVVVYGATPGGIVAAVAAARSGSQVIIIEPGQRLGGVVSGGLVYSDVCNIKGIGATAHEFFQRVGKHYKQPVMWNFEPHVAEKVFNNMVSEAGVKVEFGQQLKEVHKKGVRITSFSTEQDKEFKGRVFIDATYEGDLLATAGVSYAVGREAKDVYDETMAGVQPHVGARQWMDPISAYDEASGNLLPGIQEVGWPELGTGDRKVMGYNFRFCMTSRPDLRKEIPKPEKYDRRNFELLERFFQKNPDLKLEDMMAFHHAYKGKFCMNRKGPFSTNLIGENWNWPEASYAEREAIFERHKNHTLGFLYFLAHDESTPAQIREEMKRWGLCKDEFVDTENFPFQLYVREARRMIGEYVLNENDLLYENKKTDGIGLASCPIEVHHVQRLATEDGLVKNEGHLGYRVKPYAIPYRSVVPKSTEVDNLLVPVAISASQVAYSSLRMEPVYMILGHSVGVAASLAIKEDIPVQAVDTKKLRELLRSHTQVL